METLVATKWEYLALNLKKVPGMATEQEFNKRYQIVSTCEFRMPPQVALVGSSCQAQ